MEGLLALVGFIAILVFIEYIQKQRNNNGDKLKIIPKTYFLAIKTLISPYQTTEFAEQIINRSQKVLSDILKSYQSLKQQEKLRDDDLCKLLVDNYHDRYFVENFALIFVYSFKPYYAGFRPTDENKFAEDTAKAYCKKILLLRKNDIPNTIWYEFGIDKDRL